MSIASEITRIQAAKASLKTAIEAKGVAVPSSATIDTYYEYVEQIINMPIKLTATYDNGQSYNWACDNTSAITSADTTASEYPKSGMTSAVVGDCVTTLTTKAFEGCRKLSSITISNSVTSIGSTSAGDVFYDCISLSSVTIPNSVTLIGFDAFVSCSSLTSVTIGSGVTTIGEGAFYDCRSLSSITIPSSVTSIGLEAFELCLSLTSVTIEATNPPTLGNRAFDSSVQVFYVPCSSVDTYKAASGWSSYASKIQGIPPCYEPQYRTTSGTPYCQGYDKYVDVYSQVSNDGGQTWTTTATTPTLVESDSEDCGYEPTPQCETPENTETYPLDDDFDTTKEVWNLWPDNLADLDGDEMTEEEEYYFTGYVVLSEDGQSRDYTIVASTEGSGWTVDICEYDENGENFAGNVLTALTEDVWIGMCDYFEKPMYVMDFSQYLVGDWQGMDENEFDTYNKIYKVKMNAQDIYDTYGLETFSGQLTLNDADDGSGTVYEVGYSVEMVDGHLEATIDVIENYEQVTSYTFNLSSEEAVVDFYALFGKALYATSCDMLCVDGDDSDCQEYATLWDAFVETIGWINEFEVDVESEE